MTPPRLQEIRRERLRWPGPSDRTAIVGRTGSGKTQAALWHLSRSDFDARPWIILDYKNEELVAAIGRAIPIEFEDGVPEEPGIYVLKVFPGDDDAENISDFFYDVWAWEDVGIVIDEGYMIDPRDKWFNACLTQGRSKQISMLILSQRPVWLSRFVFSEASFFQVFDLTHAKDMDKVREYLRDDDRQLLDRELPDYCSFFYDVGRRRLEVLGPVPDAGSILRVIDQRLLEQELLRNPQPRAI